MTQEELDAIPEVGGFYTKLEERDGQTVRVPYMAPQFALYHGPDDPISVVDSRGEAWMLGRYKGVLYKRLMRP